MLTPAPAPECYHKGSQTEPPFDEGGDEDEGESPGKGQHHTIEADRFGKAEGRVEDAEEMGTEGGRAGQEGASSPSADIAR